MELDFDRKILGTIIGIGLLVFLAVGIAQNSGQKSVQVAFPGDNGNVTVQLEVADTPEERRTGLMYRESLPADSGMLFVYQKEDHRAFWMKNTLVPLDIIFLDSEKRVINVEHADPQPKASDDELRRYRSEEPAQYVIEVNQGFADNHSIEPGDQVFFSLN